MYQKYFKLINPVIALLLLFFIKKFSYYSNFWYWYWFLLILPGALCSYWPKQRWNIVSVSSVIFFVGISSKNWLFISELSTRFNEALLFDSLVYRIFYSGLIFFVGYVVLAINFKWKTKHRVAILVCVFLSLIIFNESQFLSDQVRFYNWIALVVAGQFLWGLAYQIKDSSEITDIPLWQQVALAVPFWNFLLYQIPVPRGVLDLKKHEAKNDQDLYESQLSGIKLLFLAAFCTLLSEILVQIFFGHHSYVDFHLPSIPLLDIRSGLVKFNQSNAGHLVKLVSVFLRVFTFILVLFPTYGVAVAIARLCGFKIFQFTYKPHKAKTFAQFAGRIIYYYNQILVTFFLAPISEKLRFVKNRKLRIFLSVFLAVSVGGVIFHFLRDLRDIYGQHISGGLAQFIPGIPYFILFGLVAATSTIIEEKHKKIKESKLQKLIRVGIYFVIYTFLCTLVFSMRQEKVSWDEYLKLLSGIFGW